MKKNYLLSLSLMALFSLGGYAQEQTKYKQDGAFQKTLQLQNVTSKEDALSSFGKQYGLDQNNTFQLKTENSDISGLSHQRHQQYYKGLKVEFGTVITHSRAGKVETVNGELYNAQGLDLTPTLTPQRGFDIALKFINAKTYLWENPEGAKAMSYQKPTGELLIFPMVNKAKVVLAYKYDIYATAPISRGEVFVDAHTGEILYFNPIIKHATKVISSSEMEARAKAAEAILLDEVKNTPKATMPFATSSATTRYSGVQNIQTDLSGANYILSEATRTTNGLTGNGAHTYNSGKTNTYPTTDFVNATTTWNTGNYAAASTTKDNAALDAHWGAEKVFDWWTTVFNRNSYDNNGAKILSWVHYDDAPGGAGYDNAFWNGACMTYGDGNSMNVLTALDVCGHEIGHAVCTYTADLAYQNHSGAMNEGLSDIWGSCIEWWARNGNFNMPTDGASPGTQAAWKIGEDITSGGLRSMSWPRSKGNPDTYKGTSWTGTSDDGASCTPVGDPSLPGYNDSCGVHNNSGVLNHWFYLVTIGKTNWTNNASPTRTTTTTGIGMQKSSKITYYAERDYLTPNATYTDMRNATIAVASNLYNADSQEVKTVTRAWYAVNLGADYPAAAIVNDVSLKDISGGNLSVSCGASYNPSIVIENGGTADLTAATITYNIDGGANSTINWTGNLVKNATANQLINVGVLGRGYHLLTVTVTTASDGNSDNNTRKLPIIVNDSGAVNVVNPFTAATNSLVAVGSFGPNDSGFGRVASVWERGTVNKTPLTSAATGNSAGYATKLVGNYPDNTRSYLVSQCYDLSNMTNATVSFDMAFDLEPNFDIIYFEFSTDFGATWKILGSASDSNWYNSARTNASSGTADDCQNCPGKQWTGLYATAPAAGTGVNGNKRNYSHTLNASDLAKGINAGPSNIIFRFNFVSDSGSNNTGVFIDNFLVQGTLSAAENQFENFGVYPNPSNGVFNVVLSTSEKVNVSLYDLRGRSIYNNSFANTGSVFSKELNFSTLSSGIYILNVESAGKTASKRIIID